MTTLIDHVPYPANSGEGAILEVFNALGASIAVVTVLISGIKILQPDDILSIRPLAQVS